jgi:hypothetical protein
MVDNLQPKFFGGNGGGYLCLSHSARDISLQDLALSRINFKILFGNTSWL